MDTLKGKRLAVLSNVHKTHDGRIYHREAYFAAREGMRVTVFAIDNGCSSHEVAIHAVSPPTSRLQRFLLGWRLAYAAFQQGADVYHFHDPEMLLPMTLLRIVTRKPVIYDCHENVVDSVYYKSYLPRFARPSVAKAIYLIQWLCAQLLGSVVVATEEQLEMFPAEIRHAVVRNFPPLSIQEEVGIQADRPYDLVHCGSLSRERGSHILFQLLRILVDDFGRKDCTLLLIGTSNDQLEAELKQFIVEHQLHQNIVFRGHIPLHQVPQELVRAKVGLMCHQATSQYRYGVASKLFDYMAAGLAIVGGCADFDREYAPEGDVKIYVDQTKPYEYAVAVDRLLKHTDIREQMGQNARKLFEKEYTAESEAYGLIQFYERHLSTKGAA